MKRLLQINKADNVAVILVDGDAVAPRGHKVALRPVAKGEDVIKYGFPIGKATRDIAEGEWVHSHNLATGLGDDLEYKYTPAECKLADAPAAPVVNGYLRSNGEMGIRNELWIVPTVGCVNGQANAIVDRIKSECDLTGIDDVRAFTHNYGCSQLGQDHANTRAALAALAKHPNAGGVLVLGLGCENNQIDRLREEMGEFDAERIRFLVAQHVEDEVETGFEVCKELLVKMKGDHRQPLPVTKLKLGLKCGGSDGFSGITANPLLGMLSDRMAAWGATTILTEVPEMFGAETILMNRAKNEDVFGRIVRLINDFKGYFRSYGQPIYENPSPGNKAGGITTLEEKSLGCVQKGGTSEVTDVLMYTQKCVTPGLNLLTAPGNDLVASTSLALSGCQMVLFTTGRGTPFGTFVPTMKISTNSQLAEKKHNWIDFNAGVLLDEGADPEKVVDDLVAKVVAVSDGQLLHHEQTGANEIAIFKTGVT
ncbi:MAG: altronate dehydratase family protein, partial [Muribaculaceae bacterium]|nr:altronate dehydratase family protein [Muribaculaceae bacterium]